MFERANEIARILAEHGPALTSDIAARLQAQGKSPEAARKAVSRRGGQVRILHGLPFPKRVRFIYLEDQFGTNKYWDALLETIDKSNPAYAAAIAALRCRREVVPRRHFDIACGSPIRQKG